LTWLLEESNADRVSAALEEAEMVFSSSLTLVECDRNLIRLETTRRLSAIEVAERRAILAERIRYWVVLGLDEEVIDRARNRFPYEPVRSLDALHLASALVAARAAVGTALLSLDDRIRKAGRALGFEILPN
jgi:predicted nucleic acid-binding protein